MPESLRCIEVRRVRGQRKHLDVAAVFGKELQDFGFLVKRRIVLNQIHSMAATIIMWQQLFIHERQVRFGVEILGLVPPDKITGGHAHRPQNLLGVAFASRGNLRLLTAARPSPIKRGRLPKGGFVFVDNQRAFTPGVFFRFGWVNRIHRFCFLGSACTRRVLGRCTEKFRPLSKFRTCPG